MVNIKRGKRPIIQKLDILNAILNMIPHDGSCIQYKKLDEFRKQKQFGVGTLNDSLKELVEEGILLKEAIKLSHGAGTCYRLAIPIPKLDKFGWPAFIREHKRRIAMAKNPDEKEKAEALYFTRALENYLNIIFRTLEKAKEMDPEAAEGFIDAAGKTYIAGLLKDINSLITAEFLFNWDDVPGNDSDRLIKFLQDYFLMVLEKVDIRKSEDRRTIYVSKGEDPSKIMAEIRIDEEKEKAILKTHDNITHELKAKKENGKLKIYTIDYKTQALEITRVAFGHPSFQLKEASIAVKKRRNLEKRTDEEEEKYIKETFGFY